MKILHTCLLGPVLSSVHNHVYWPAISKKCGWRIDRGVLYISVVFSEPGAGLFPLALGAPLLAVVHPVHLAALLGVASGTTDGGLAWSCRRSHCRSCGCSCRLGSSRVQWAEGGRSSRWTPHVLVRGQPVGVTTGGGRLWLGAEPDVLAWAAGRR